MIQSNNLERLMIVSGVSDAGILYRSTWGANGGSLGASAAPANLTFPGLDSSKDHLQATAPARSSFIAITNNDATKRIVLSMVEVGWNNGGVTDPKAMFGTFAEEDSTSDLVIWMCDFISGNYSVSTPITLAPGKDLIHYNVRGPGQGNSTEPVFLKLFYHLVDA
tara:strand:+ start:26197 stop:26691 length:495 start_codon:yes stop_codon:yes gene_type:complete